MDTNELAEDSKIGPLHLYADGSCRPNPGPGGWGFCKLNTDKTPDVCFYGGDPGTTTNNRMELIAVINAIQYYIEHVEKYKLVNIFTDSNYVVIGVNKRLRFYVKQAYMRYERGANGETTMVEIKNKDLWIKLHETLEAADKAYAKQYGRKQKVVHVKWVKGHSTNTGNNIADSLANMGRIRALEDKEVFSSALLIEKTLKSN